MNILVLQRKKIIKNTEAVEEYTKMDRLTKAYLRIISEETEEKEENEDKKTENASIEIADDADFEEAMDAVIGKNVLVKFNYRNKEGESYEVEAIPYDMFENEKTGQKAIRAYLNGDENEIRTYYIDSMGDAKVDEEEAEEDNENLEEMMTDKNED